MQQIFQFLYPKYNISKINLYQFKDKIADFCNKFVYSHICTWSQANNNHSARKSHKREYKSNTRPIYTPPTDGDQRQ